MPSHPDSEEQPFLKYSDDPTITALPHDLSRQKRRSIVFSHSAVFIATSLLWIIVIFAISPPMSYRRAMSRSDPSHNVTSDAKLVTCGNNPYEARIHHCSYDVLLNMWVPAQCLDDEFVAEYIDDASWAAYADPEMTQKIESIKEMSERDHYYTSVRDHVNHCAVMWKKQFWMLFEQRNAFDSVIASPGHTDHCAQYLMDSMGANITESTRVEVGFAGCWVRE